MEILKELNTSQHLAVTTTEGPVMVMAGAGSGKTRVLTSRIAYLISELGIPTSQILAVTFTNKAAKEMKERVEKMLNIDTRYMWISTFHSFCSRLLRIEMNHLPPFTKNFTIIDEEDSVKIIKEILKNAKIEDAKPKEIQHLISKSKNFTDFSISDPFLNKIFVYVDTKYHEYLKENNLLDFDDLILKTIELFKKNPEILEKYQNKFEYILVDEFQDTNTLQYNLIYMLSIRYQNIFVVGDDFQSIYSFRGAKIENINRFRSDFIAHKLILLEENYRSTIQILNLANSIIKHNPNQIKKVMYSNKTEGQLPFYYHADSSYGEVMYVIDKIRELVALGDSYRDFAILYRANYISRNFEDMLIRYQIPYKVYGGTSFFARKEIKDMVAYLRVLVHPDDDFSFRRIINEPKRKIGPKVLEELTNLAAELQESLYNAIPYFDKKTAGAVSLKEFKSCLDSIREKIENVSLKDLIDELMRNTGYEESLKKDEDSYEDRLGNIRELKSVLKEAEEFYNGDNTTKLELLLSDLSLRTDADNDEFESDDCVRLSTYHQVKGLEFKNVFMVAMEEGIFPSSNYLKEVEIEEERRICYVGITRAKQRLYITNAETRFLFGTQNSLLPSRFISEMAEELLNSKGNKHKKSGSIPMKKSSLVEKPIEKKEETIFSVGDKINHKAFGDGLVVEVNLETITVAFPMPIGIKKLMANHPAIRKL